ncbi:MAG: hypothetical protein QW606_01035 [Conexivisphaerales archaeon]
MGSQDTILYPDLQEAEGAEGSAWGMTRIILLTAVDSYSTGMNGSDRS